QKALKTPGPENRLRATSTPSNLLAMPQKIQLHNRLSIHQLQPTLQRQISDAPLHGQPIHPGIRTPVQSGGTAVFSFVSVFICRDGSHTCRLLSLGDWLARRLVPGADEHFRQEQERTMRTQRVLLCAIICGLLSSAGARAAEWGLKEGTPDLKSAGP